MTPIFLIFINNYFLILNSTSFGRASPQATSNAFIIAAGTGQATYLQYFSAALYTQEVPIFEKHSSKQSISFSSFSICFILGHIENISTLLVCV
jgi:hypothetical protein